MKKFLTAAVAAIVVLAGSTSLRAQSPEDQMLVGGIVGGSGAAATIGYALSPAFHLGTTLGIAFNDGSNSLLFGPYAKFIMKGSTEFKPFFFGQFEIGRTAATGNSSNAITTTILRIGAGGEYFITRNFGVFVVLPVLQAGFHEGANTQFGILAPSIGAEWFL